jgi:hypothetical protein
MRVAFFIQDIVRDLALRTSALRRAERSLSTQSDPTTFPKYPTRGAHAVLASDWSVLRVSQPWPHAPNPFWLIRVDSRRFREIQDTSSRVGNGHLAQHGVG